MNGNRNKKQENGYTKNTFKQYINKENKHKTRRATTRSLKMRIRHEDVRSDRISLVFMIFAEEKRML